ncbi:MAG: undecaprenyl-phosphate glucose phosphotransferase [Chloroflexota bacterium]|nr:undecaprenyl-phosphate glucose phosphotransferase [Chloroflexota bacterium]
MSRPARYPSKDRRGRLLTLAPRVVEPAADSVAARNARRKRWRLAFLFPLSLMALDGLMVAVAFFLAFRLRLVTEYIGPLVFSDYYGMLVIQVMAMVTTYFFYKLYQRRRVMSYVDELGHVIAGTSVGIVVTLAVSSFLFKNDGEFDYPRLMVVYAWALTIMMVTIGRYLHGRVRWRLQSAGVATQNVLLVGSGEAAQMILNAIERMPGLGYRVVGVVRAGPQNGHARLSKEVVGTVDDLPMLIDRLGVDEVIIGMPEANHHEVLGIIHGAQREKVSIKVFPDLFQFIAGEMTIDDLNGLPLLTVRDIALRGWKLGVKRAMDVAFSATVLVILSPLMLLVALLIKLESEGPVFFTQERMGLDAKPFRIIKFRSMRQDAEQYATWTTEDDPRVTRIGRIIRRTSIDELPQLINVLLGEMSLVGPRPEQLQYVEEFRRIIPRYMDRHQEKAGLTGWAQVNGLRGDTSIFERTKYDLWYIENWSPTLDIKIILRTALKALFDRNAY